MMLAPVYLLDGYNGNIGEDTDYILAQKDGYFGRDCSRYHHDCPASLFSVSLGLFPYLNSSNEFIPLDKIMVRDVNDKIQTAIS